MALSRALRSHAWYLNLAISACVIGQFLQFATAGQPWVKGQSAAIIVQIILIAISFILWVFYTSNQQWEPSTKLAIIMMLGAWSLTIVQTRLHDSVFALTAYIVPVLLLMLYVKAVTFAAVEFTARVFSYLLIAIGIASLFADSASKTLDTFDPARTGYSRLPLLGDLFHITARWEGPYGNVNYAAPVGGFLLVFAMAQKGIHRWLILAGGAFVLVLSQGRSALFATLAGLLVLLIFSRFISSFTYAKSLRIGLVSFALICVVSYIAILDPTLALRTDVWHDFVVLWQTSPLVGAGSDVIAQYSAHGAYLNDTQFLSIMAPVHGHSVFIDTLTRFGIIGTLALLATLCTIGYVAVKATMRGSVIGLAIFVFTVVAGLTETTFGFTHLGVLSVPLLLSLLLSGSYLSDSLFSNREERPNRRALEDIV